MTARLALGANHAVMTEFCAREMATTSRYEEHRTAGWVAASAHGDPVRWSSGVALAAPLVGQCSEHVDVLALTSPQTVGAGECPRA